MQIQEFFYTQILREINLSQLVSNYLAVFDVIITKKLISRKILVAEKVMNFQTVGSSLGPFQDVSI